MISQIKFVQVYKSLFADNPPFVDILVICGYLGDMLSDTDSNDFQNTTLSKWLKEGHFSHKYGNA